jgi:hypothetical protein
MNLSGYIATLKALRTFLELTQAMLMQIERNNLYPIPTQSSDMAGFPSGSCAHIQNPLCSLNLKQMSHQHTRLILRLK